MNIIKYIMLVIVFVLSTILGRKLSMKYKNRLVELENMKIALNIFKTKINYTYSPIPEIFDEISNKIGGNIGKIFKTAKEKMKFENANIAWEESIKKESYLNQEDIEILKNLSKLLGQTDAKGQISQIDVTQNFLENQIKEAYEEKMKNEKLYCKLGTTIGLAIVIILF